MIQKSEAETQDQFLVLVDKVHTNNEEVIITRDGRPIAKMIAIGEEEAWVANFGPMPKH